MPSLRFLLPAGLALILSASLSLPRPAAAQFAEDFTTPLEAGSHSWQGDVTAFVVDVSAGVLRTDGAPYADTLVLATSSAVAAGTWTFDVSTTGVNLSTSNGVRFYLMTDRPTLDGPVNGYFVQVGTNNSDEIRLYRQDGDPGTGRVLLERSEVEVASDDEIVRLRATRTHTGTWTVWRDDRLLFTADDNRHRDAGWMGLWVKHSATAGSAYAFDAIRVDAAPPDETPAPGDPIMPGDVVINEILFAPDDDDLEFVEILNRSPEPVSLSRLAIADARRRPIALASDNELAPGAAHVIAREPELLTAVFGVSNVTGVAAWPALNNSGDQVILSDALSGLTVDSVAYAGNWSTPGRALERLDPASLSQYAGNWLPSRAPLGATPGGENSVYAPDLEPPELVLAAFSRAGDTLTAVVSEPADASLVTAQLLSVLTGQRHAVRQLGSTRWADTLRFDVAERLEPGRYRVLLSSVADPRGNVSAELEINAWLFSDAPLSTGAVAINEVLAAPGPWQHEFVEVVNLSQTVLDPARLSLGDAVDVATTGRASRSELLPDSMAVLLPAFAEGGGWDGALTIRYHGWPTLNDGGDRIVVYYDGAVIDSMSYPAAPDAGTSLERVDPRVRPDYPGNWAPGAPASGGTPGKANTHHAVDTSPPRVITALQDVDGVVHIAFDDALDPGSEEQIIARVGRQRLRANVSRTDWHVLTLSTPPDLAPGPVELDAVANVSGMAYIDGAVAVAWYARPGDLLLTEVLFDPRQDANDGLPDQPEYLEVFNPRPWAISLHGMRVSDPQDEQGRWNSSARVDSGIVVPPGGYVVFADCPADAPDCLAQAFPVTPAESDAGLVGGSLSAHGLANDGQHLHLVSGRDESIAELTYTPTMHSAERRLADATTGVALERVFAEAPAAGDLWASSVAVNGGTPGRANSVSPLASESRPSSASIRMTPSPFSPDGDGYDDMTTLTLDLADEAFVRVHIYDAEGRPVRALLPAALASAARTIVWNGEDDQGRRLPIGLYVVLVETSSAQGRRNRYRLPVVLAR